MTENGSESRPAVPWYNRPWVTIPGSLIVSALLTLTATNLSNLYSNYSDSIENEVDDFSSSVEGLDAELMTFAEIATDHLEFDRGYYVSLRKRISVVLGDGREIVAIVPDSELTLRAHEDALIGLQEAARNLRGAMEGGKKFYQGLATYIETRDDFILSVQRNKLSFFGFLDEVSS